MLQPTVSLLKTAIVNKLSFCILLFPIPRFRRRTEQECKNILGFSYLTITTLPVAHHRNVRPYYVFDPQQPEKYYSTQVNYYAPLDDSDDDTVDTVPTTDSESDTDYSSDEETIVASNCSRQSSATGGVGEGVLKSQSRVTHIPGLSSLASSATLSGHNIS